MKVFAQIILILLNVLQLEPVISFFNNIDKIRKRKEYLYI